MLRVLENDRLCVKIADTGAELTSIYDKANHREVLWTADPVYWDRHSPILFPNVGRHYRNVYRVNGKEYPSVQHGFARDMEFCCESSSQDTVVHTLSATPETRTSYPFDFKLTVKHILKGNELTVYWEVKNAGDDTMYFTIGGHPGFNVPASADTDYDSYFLSFDGQETLEYRLVDTATGTIVPKGTRTLELKNGTYPLNKQLFANDALVFDGNQIKRAGILFPDGTPYVELTGEGFPSFGIWAAPGAPFVCLEPWMGRADDTGFDGELSEKQYINKLEARDEFRHSYNITIF